MRLPETGSAWSYPNFVITVVGILVLGAIMFYLGATGRMSVGALVVAVVIVSLLGWSAQVIYHRYS